MSDENYSEDRKFGDKFLWSVKSILGQVLLSENYEEEDRKHNTDLIVLKMKEERIGVRIRRYYYYLKYPNEFTIRCKRQSGVETEFRKIMTGYGKYFFYGFANEDETDLIKWFIGDFEKFRDYVLSAMWTEGRDFINSRKKSNIDSNGSEFLVFQKLEIPDFIIADSDDWPPTNATKEV